MSEQLPNPAGPGDGYTPSELLEDPGHTRADVRMAIRALREGWITKDDAKIRRYLKLKTAALIQLEAEKKVVNLRKFRGLVKLYAELESLALGVVKAEIAAESSGAVADAAGPESPVRRILSPPLYPDAKLKHGTD